MKSIAFAQRCCGISASLLSLNTRHTSLQQRAQLAFPAQSPSAKLVAITRFTLVVSRIKILTHAYVYGEDRLSYWIKPELGKESLLSGGGAPTCTSPFYFCATFRHLSISHPARKPWLAATSARHSNGDDMSYFRYSVQSCTRGNATDHVAYISRHGRHAKRADLLYTEFGNMPDWAATPEDFWSAADRYERKNGVPLRQITVSLPSVQTHAENVALAKEITIALAGDKPFHLAVHAPTSAIADQPNPHAHLAICDRAPDGFSRPPELMFRRYNPGHPEKGGRRKDSGGRTPTELRQCVLHERQVVAEITNKALATNGYAERVDARSLRQQGVARAPERYLGPARIRAMSSDSKREFVANRRKEG